MTIASAGHAPPAEQARPARPNEKAPPSKPDAGSGRADTVKISPAARAAVVAAQTASHAAVHESQQTRTQAATHATHVHQAQTLVAKHAAAAYRAHAA